MAVRAVVFDIGGVLETAPRTGWVKQWEARLGLTPGELLQRTNPVWSAGTRGTLSEHDVHVRLQEILGLDAHQLDRLMADVWTEYLGTLNVPMADYFAGLRPR